MMENDTTIIVVRHGETVWNRELRMQGNSDSPLSELGVRQARSVARRLSAMTFSALYSSDLGRAQRTAQSIGEVTGHAIMIDARLRERGFGVLEGLTRSELEARDAEDYARFRSCDPDYVIPGGESARATYERVIACFEEIAARHRGETVAVVSHGLVLDALYRHAARMPLHLPRTLRLLNASFNTFFRDNETWRLGPLGDVAHLDDVAMTLA